MAALKLDMNIPVGDAGHIHLLIDIADIGALTETQRQVLADTGRDFYDFAAATIAPETPPKATVYDPNLDVLNGVRGTRANTS